MEIGGKKRYSRRSSRKGSRKGSKARRPLNPYMKFVKATRASVVKAHPKLSVTEIAKKLGAMWRAMSDAEKKKFQ